MKLSSKNYIKGLKSGLWVIRAYMRGVLVGSDRKSEGALRNLGGLLKLMFAFFNKEKSNDESPSRTRFVSSPNITFKSAVESPPLTKLHNAIQIDGTYFDTEYATSVEDIKKLNCLVSSFFTDSLEEVPPYSKQEWSQVLREPKEKRDKERLYSSIRVGLPQEYRRQIWHYLAEIERLKYEFNKKGITYEELKSKACGQDDKIKKDIVRSFNDHVFFMNHDDRLKNVQHMLRAYANLDPDVGYTQGMNFLVGMLLYLVHSEYKKDGAKSNRKNSMDSKGTLESEVFWILVYIMQEKNWRELYLHNTPKLQELLGNLDLQVKEKLPSLYKLMAEFTCLPGCFSQHLMTLLIFNSPLELAKRVLEAFLVVGEDIIIHVLIEALKICEGKLLHLDNIEEFYSLLKDQLLMSVLQQDR